MATNTSRVSPTLCHILRAGGWTRAQRLVAGRLGDMGGGCPRAAPPGGGTGRCGGGRGGVGPQTRPPTPDRGDRVAGRAGGPRGATTASSLRGAGATACRGRGERTRCHGGHRRERRECGGGAAAARPWLRLLRGPLGPQRRQMSTTPRGRRRRRCSSTPPQQLHQAPTPQRLRRCAGLAGKWSAKLRACYWSLPYKELQFPGLNTVQGFSSLSFALSFSRPLCLWYSGVTTSEDCWLMFSKSLCCAMGCLPY